MAMLLEQNNPKVVRGILVTGLLTVLTGCGNTANLETMLQPDPELVSQLEVREVSSQTDNTQSSSPKLSTDNQGDQAIATESDSGTFTDNPNSSASDLTKVKSNLPPDFPSSFPIYPQVTLQETKIGEKNKSGMLTWTSSDNTKAIADYYQGELTARNWKIIKPFTFNPQQKIARAIAIKDEQRVDLTLLPTKNPNGKNATKLSVIYQPLAADITVSGISQELNDNSTPDFSAKPNQTKSQSDQPQRTVNSSSEPTVQPNELALKNLENTKDFTDLREASEQLIAPLETVAALGILTPYTSNGNVELTKFAPNAIITRGEYARWLIAANNYYYQDSPGKKIYVSNTTNEPAFQDIKRDNPDFSAIQGLAEAGLVPSRLTQDSTKLLFRPQAPLTREDLITWKVPLDSRQALPKASIEAIQESWGFQDAADIDSSAVRALYADFQNGDLANVRRIFGFTTLFQPKKPVTRAEAAASLWYFGFQGDGITAQEILETEVETTTETNVKPPSDS